MSRSNIVVAYLKSYVYLVVHFLSFLPKKKLIRNPKLPYLPPLMKNVRVDWCWKMKKCSEAFLNLHLMTRKILFLWNSNPSHNFMLKKKLPLVLGLLPKLFWPTVIKNCSSDREKLLKFEAEGREFEKFLRSLEQFIQTVKGQNNFW